MAKRGITIADLKKIPVEVGLQTEKGYPHKGTLDYAAPNVDPSTGTLAVRGDPAQPEPAAAARLFRARARAASATSRTCCWCPTEPSAATRAGRYVLVAGKDDVVEQRTVEIGQLVGELRVILSGIGPDDRVVISGMLTAVPGQKIEPQLKTLPPTPADGAAQ